MFKVSIITVVYNDVYHIDKTINNVLKQTYPNLEYIVIDGNSSDGTRDVIKKYDGKIKWISEPDKGIYDAMMKGACLASGDWILFRNCGDFFYSPEAIETLFNEYSEDNGEDFLLANSRLFKDWGYFDEKPAIISCDYMDRMPVLHPSTFIRRKTQLKFPFHLEYHNSADYCFFIEAFKNGAKYRYFDMLISIIDCTSGVTAETFEQTINDNIAIKEKFNASHLQVKSLKKMLRKHKLSKAILRFFPFLSLYFRIKDKQRGWIVCSKDVILADI